jgi:hypothetical protein
VKTHAVTYAERITNYERQKQETSVLKRSCVASLHSEQRQLFGFSITNAKEENDYCKLVSPKVYLQKDL